MTGDIGQNEAATVGEKCKDEREPGFSIGSDTVNERQDGTIFFKSLDIDDGNGLIAHADEREGSAFFFRF